MGPSDDLLSRKLRAIYGSGTERPLPPDFMDLLELIDRADENGAWRQAAAYAARSEDDEW